MRRAGFWLFVWGIVAAFLPAISLLIAMGLAHAAGCPLDEAGAHPCILLGTDWGSLLASMAIAGWLLFFSIPAGGLVSLVGLVLYLVARFRGR